MVSQNFEILPIFRNFSKLFERCSQAPDVLLDVQKQCYKQYNVSVPSLQAVRAETMVDGLPRAVRFFCGLGVYRCQWSIRNPDNWERKVEVFRDSTDWISLSSRQNVDDII